MNISEQFNLLCEESKNNTIVREITLCDNIYKIFAYSPYLGFDNERFQHELDESINNIIDLYRDNKPIMVIFSIPVLLSLYDKKNDTLILSRDQFGVVPVYWCLENNNLNFATSAKKLIKRGFCSNKINLQAVDLFFTLQYIPGENTIWKKIRKLPAGTELRWTKGGKVHLKQYYDIADDQYFSGYSDQSLLKRQLLHNCEMYSKLCGNGIILMSGGMDSTINALNLSNSCSEHLGLTVKFREEGFDESELASYVAQYLNIEHKLATNVEEDLFNIRAMIMGFEEPNGDQAALATYSGLKKINTEKYHILYSGEGGDEIFGFPRKFSMINKISFDSEREMLKRYIVNLEYLSSDIRNNIYLQTTKKYIEDDYLLDLLSDLALKANSDSTLFKLKYIQFYTWMIDNVIVKDRAVAEAFQLSAAFPLLNMDIVRSVFAITKTDTYNKLINKNFIREVYKNDLPETIINKPKHTFSVPVKNWFNDSNFLNKVFNNMFDKSNILWGILKYDEVKNLYDMHIKGERNLSLQLWQLFSFSEWLAVSDIDL